MQQDQVTLTADAITWTGASAPLTYNTVSKLTINADTVGNGPFTPQTIAVQGVAPGTNNTINAGANDTVVVGNANGLLTGIGMLAVNGAGAGAGTKLVVNDLQNQGQVYSLLTSGSRVRIVSPRSKARYGSVGLASATSTTSMASG